MAAKKSVLGTEYQSAFMRERAKGAPSVDAPTKKKYRPVSVAKVSFWLMPEAVDSWRDAVGFLSRTQPQLTLSGFVQDACNAEVQRLARKHHEGKPFPKRKAGDSLKRGSRPRS